MQSVAKNTAEQKATQVTLDKINQEIEQLLGSPQLVKQLEDKLNSKNVDVAEVVGKFVEENSTNPGKGIAFC